MKIQDFGDAAKQVGNKALEWSIEGAKWLGRQIQWVGRGIVYGAQKIWNLASALLQQAYQLGYKYLWSPAKDIIIKSFYAGKDFVFANPQLCIGIGIGLGAGAIAYLVNKFACQKAQA